MRTFLFFQLELFVAGFASIFAWAIWLYAITTPLALVAKFGKTAAAPALKILAPVIVSFHVYYWLFWAFVCVSITQLFIHSPEVRHPWIYWICGALESVGPIYYMAEHETERNEFVITLLGISAFFGFIAMAIWPQITPQLFPWFTL